MALLVTVIGLAAPTLSRFFRARTLEEETRRFLALTRYGQERAISAGVPMVLWLDTVSGTYGLREQNGFGSRALGVVPTAGLNPRTPVTKNFRLSDRLHFELPPPTQGGGPQTVIRFGPDGAIDDSSPRYVILRQDDRSGLAVVQADSHLTYEISQDANPAHLAQWTRH